MENRDAYKCTSRDAASLLRSYANLCASAIGIGVLAYPLAFRQSGVGAGLASASAFCAVNCGILLLLAACLSALARRGARVASFEELCREAGSRVGGKCGGTCMHGAAVASILCNQFGQLLASLVLCATLLEPSLPAAWRGLLARACIIALFMLLLCPLFFAHRISSLGCTSTIAVAIVGFIVFVIALRLGEHGAASDVEWLIADQLRGSAKSIPIYVFTFGCQLQFVSTWAESFAAAMATAPVLLAGAKDRTLLEPTKDRPLLAEHAGDAELGAAAGAGAAPARLGALEQLTLAPSEGAIRRVERQMRCVVVANQCTCLLVYAAMGTLGYALLGDGTIDSRAGGDVLLGLSLSGSDVLAIAARWTLCLHLAFAFPVFIYPAHSAIISLLDVLAVAARGLCDHHGVGGQENRVKDDDHDALLSRARRRKHTSTLILIVWILGAALAALFVPKIEDVFNLIGSTVGTTINITLPALCVMLIRPAQCFCCGGSSLLDVSIGAALLLASVAITIGCTTLSVL